MVKTDEGKIMLKLTVLPTLSSEDNTSIPFLPRIVLEISFDLLQARYPSTDPPIVTISGFYKNLRMEIVSKLYEIYNDSGGAPILFDWVMYLKDEVVQDAEPLGQLLI